MGLFKFAVAAPLALALGVDAAAAQVVLPELDVTASRIVNTGPARSAGDNTAMPSEPGGGTAPTAGPSIGLVGASTSVITSDQIDRSPSQTLTDILSQQTGVQTQHLFSSTNGSRDTVDLRGFGPFAPSNVLVLVNGRRYQDFDLQGFDFASIPLNSIDRIEITRGNSGTVLYGDGAIGGVINIVTKTKTATPFSGRVEGLFGSYGYREGRTSAAASSGPWSVSVFGNAAASNGYRVNSSYWQQNINGNINYTGAGWGAYFNVAADQQRQSFPGALYNVPTPSVGPYTLDMPWQSNTPLDWGKKQGLNFTGGFNTSLGSGIDLILDGGVRRKFQQGQFYQYVNFPPPLFNPVFDVATATPANYVGTVMTTSSFTPRLDIHHNLFGVPGRLLTGVDLYNTQYNSDRPSAPGLVPVHSFDIRQLTTGFYAFNTSTVRPDTDISFGGRLQRNSVKGRDVYNATNDPNAGFYPTDPQAPPLDMSEWQWAAHLGIEHRLSQNFSVFGRVARAFRLGNADERVGAGGPFVFTVPNLNLKTQTSYDVEGGVRADIAGFHLESSVYLMRLNNEIHFLPSLFVDTNLDPTQRIGWETSVSYQIRDDLRVRGGAAYTDAKFRSGPYAGNEIPVVSRWTGNAGLTWDIVGKLAVLDLTGKFFGPRRMDDDQMNQQPLIPGQATFDAKLGGEYQHVFWSVAVLNLLDRRFYDYAVGSQGTAPGPFVPAGIPPTVGLFNAYPLAGRTVMVRAGATF